MTLVGPALRMPGLPAIARASARGDADGLRTAKRIATRLSAAAFVLVVCYFVVLETTGGRLLSGVFGRSFHGFDDLILPVGIGQLSGAAALGFYVLLRAQGRGRTVFGVRVITAVLTLALIPPLTLKWHVSGAAWGSSLGASAGWVLVGVMALRRPSVRRRSARATASTRATSTAAGSIDPEPFDGEAFVGGLTTKVTGGIGP
jgi:O-antigen/teichoic acid export membrane protein